MEQSPDWGGWVRIRELCRDQGSSGCLNKARSLQPGLPEEFEPCESPETISGTQSLAPPPLGSQIPSPCWNSRSTASESSACPARAVSSSSDLLPRLCSHLLLADSVLHSFAQLTAFTALLRALKPLADGQNMPELCSAASSIWKLSHFCLPLISYSEDNGV